MDTYNEYVNDYMNSYNCPDCNEANLQSDKNARKINEVINQVNALIQVNNETVEFIEKKVNEIASELIEEKADDLVGGVAEEKVNEVIGDLNTEIDNINSSLDNLENEVNELKDGNIDIDLNNYATKDYVEDAINNAKLDGGDVQVDLNNYATKDYVEEAINNAKLDGGDVQVDLSTYAKKTDLHDHSNKAILDSITTSKVNQWDNKSNFDGNYNNLTNKPTSLPANGGNASTVGGFSFWFGTQTDYDAIATKSNTTIYMIKEG